MTPDPRVQDIRDRALAEIAGARGTSELEQIRVRVLGRSGALTALLRGLGALPPEERPRVGQEANRAKVEIEARLAGAPARPSTRPSASRRARATAST